MSDRYPQQPGWRVSPAGSTSREAAAFVAPHAPRQADLALDVIRDLGCASPEQIVEALRARGHAVLLTSIRARTTGLYKQGRLMPSGEYGKGESGKVRVIKWRCATPEEQALHLASKTAANEKEHGDG